MSLGNHIHAKPASFSATIGGTEYTLEKVLDGDYLALSPTTGEVVNIVKGYNGNSASAVNMQNTIGTLTIRVQANDAFYDKAMEILNVYNSADSASLESVTITDISFTMIYEDNGTQKAKAFRASNGIISSFATPRANASGDASQSVGEFVMKLPTVEFLGTSTIV